jgi:hypothetical protein
VVQQALPIEELILYKSFFFFKKKITFILQFIPRNNILTHCDIHLDFQEKKKGKFSELDFYKEVYTKKDRSFKEGTLSSHFLVLIYRNQIYLNYQMSIHQVLHIIFDFLTGGCRH